MNKSSQSYRDVLYSNDFRRTRDINIHNSHKYNIKHQTQIVEKIIMKILKTCKAIFYIT